MRPFRDLPIRWKLLIGGMAIIVAALVTQRVVIAVIELREYRESRSDAALTLADIVGQNSIAALTFNDPNAGATTLASFKVHPEVVAAGLYKGGRLFASYIKEGAGYVLPVEPGSDRADFQDARLIAVRTVVQEGKPVGTACVVLDLSRAYETFRFHNLIAAGVVFMTVLVALGLSTVIQRRFSRPLLDLAGQAKEVSERKDYSIRAIKHGEDEIGVLVDGFNDMLAQIQTRDAALRRSMEEFRATFELAAVGKAQVDPNTGLFQRVNAKLCAITGYSADELQRMTFAQVTHPEDREEDLIRFQRMIKREAPEYISEKRYLRKDGQVIWVNVNAVVLRDPAGHPYTTVAVIQDITERKRAEDALQDSQADLNRAQAVAQTGSWRMDVQRNVLLWSDESYRIFGIPLGTPMRYEMFLALVHADDRDFVDKAWQAALGGKPYDIEHRIVVEGAIKWVREQAELEFDDRGALRGGFGTVQDITGRKCAEMEILKLNSELEERVRQRTAQLEALNKELEAFAYSVSHDLRAPLRAIDGFSSIVADTYADKLDESGKGYLRRVRDAAQKMGQLIDDMLLLSRATRGEIKHEKVNLSAMATEIANALALQEPRRPVEFKIAPDLVATGDARQLRILLDNLLGNAWKYTGKREKAFIEVGQTEVEGKKAFFVRDNGAGFNMAYIDRLFHPFQRLHSAHDFSGTGVGLATVQRIMQRHGGRAWAEGKPDEGATFYFCLE